MSTHPSSGALTSRARRRHVLLIRRTATPETSSGLLTQGLVEIFFLCVCRETQGSYNKKLKVQSSKFKCRVSAKPKPIIGFRKAKTPDLNFKLCTLNFAVIMGDN